MLLTPFAADAKDEKTQAFVTAYEEAYGDTPNQFAADAYDVVYAIYQAALAGNINEMCIRDRYIPASYPGLCDPGGEMPVLRKFLGREITMKKLVSSVLAASMVLSLSLIHI